MNREEIGKTLAKSNLKNEEFLPILAVFDQLTAEVKEWQGNYNVVAWCAKKLEEENITLIAENERLKNTPAAILYANQLAEVVELRDKYRIAQSHLDKISEPSKAARQQAKGPLCPDWGWVKDEEHRRIADYLDSQSEKPYCNHWSIKDYSKKHSGKQVACPTCNPPKCEHKNLSEGLRSVLGNRQWCLDCATWVEPLYKQCPECGGTRQRIINYPYLRTYPHNETKTCYRVYERCPRCRGEGIIAK